jgi:glycosyltransferase involved in cell wall biosynthesis
LSLELSVVVPVFDEEDSIEPLYREIDAALSSLGAGLEMIWVDDGSRDRSAEILAELDRKDTRVRVITLAGNQGQSAALDAGFRAVRAPVTVTLDADLQNDPADIPMLLEHLAPDVDVVNGVRVGRRDSRWKILTSRVANALRNRLTQESVTDVGCSLRVIRTPFLRRITLERGLHRFLPTLLRLEGARMVEVPVSHRARRYGRSKYGLRNRLLPAIVDLLAVRRMAARRG